MNPYNIDIDELRDSKEIISEKDLLKLKLVSELLRATNKMSSAEFIEKSKIDKSDLSRMRALDLERFTIDRVLNYIERLGLTTKKSKIKVS
ncbi:MAG: hypothetical protein CL677_00375 [Bdellovibrionaceae bacterium]|jgi:predicted XRE-type DNA-binding protein|nr:hypothetical protein [Pseudobdellovibrionaceae bacterium]|tara:strand:+ start:3584 stop:3856 length:273 start_codon:yes stop_codon:yes gene_type:complete